ncbi:MAG TPA: hypothetical protein P5055_08785 [Candidatus Paceibacterota bacterium]|nr:hypothetical protein [Verrucomicrobiota bacterium]HSA00821.1 hypothetical protein [Candidatus Paceibacterota bacterium]
MMTPEVLGSALVREEEGWILECWRDGVIQPIVNRAWLVRCLRLMHRLGLPEIQIRRWGWWLGSAIKCHATSDVSYEISGKDLYEHLARTASAAYIVYGHSGILKGPEMTGAGSGAAWISLADFLKKRSGHAESVPGSRERKETSEHLRAESGPGD